MQPTKHILQRALEQVGSRHRLGAMLRLPPHELEVYLTGNRIAPPAIFAGAVDIVRGAVPAER